MTQSSSLSVEDHYSQVCGKIRAYQWGLPNAFIGYNYYGHTIDSAYVSGVAVMYGSPRQHIWTFAVGSRENNNPSSRSSFPCDPRGDPVPPFIGNDYFCESGYVYGSGTATTLHSNDTLWDGRDPPVHVVLSTILHISPKTLTRQLLMTWN